MAPSPCCYMPATVCSSVCSYRHAVAPCMHSRTITGEWRDSAAVAHWHPRPSLGSSPALSLQRRRRRAPGSETGGQGDQGFNSLSPCTFQRLEKAQIRNGSYPPCIMLIPWSSLPSKKASFMHVNSTHPLSDPVPRPVRSMRLLLHSDTRFDLRALHEIDRCQQMSKSLVSRALACLAHASVGVRFVRAAGRLVWKVVRRAGGSNGVVGSRAANDEAINTTQKQTTCHARIACICIASHWPPGSGWPATTAALLSIDRRARHGIHSHRPIASHLQRIITVTDE